ncbi:MAG: LPP20 family lipoprotein [Flavobacteriales bacterium]|nr:LPP20 family lipoprotein [Flavobacteriales bacterium]
MLYKIKPIYLFLTFSLLMISCGSSKKTQKTSVADKESEMPSWINNYKNDYPDLLYLSSLGVSEYKGIAEKQAYEGIAAAFEVQIKSSQSSKEVTLEDDNSFSQTYSEVFDINTSTDQDLINVNTSESYFDAKTGKYYVLATLNKSQTSVMYQRDRSKLLDTSKSIYISSKQESDPLTKVALISNSISMLLEVNTIESKLRILDNSSMPADKFKSIHSLVLEREKILENVKVYIDNSDDKVYSILKKEFTSLGFKVSLDKSKALLLADYSLVMNNSEVVSQDAKFVMWSLDVSLNHILKNHSFGTYSAKGRSSQLSYGAARERAYFDLEKKLDNEFKGFLISKILRTEGN